MAKHYSLFLWRQILWNEIKKKSFVRYTTDNFHGKDPEKKLTPANVGTVDSSVNKSENSGEVLPVVLLTDQKSSLKILIIPVVAQQQQSEILKLTSIETPLPKEVAPAPVNTQRNQSDIQKLAPLETQSSVEINKRFKVAPVEQVFYPSKSLSSIEINKGLKVAPVTVKEDAFSRTAQSNIATIPVNRAPRIAQQSIEITKQMEANLVAFQKFENRVSAEIAQIEASEFVDVSADHENALVNLKNTTRKLPHRMYKWKPKKVEKKTLKKDSKSTPPKNRYN